VNAATVEEHIKLMPRGQWYEYHRGFLARDRGAMSLVDLVASIVYEAYEKGNGRFALIQRRHGVDDNTYYIVRVR
jgi:hypothetical protein